ncbi:hypothetical protein D3C85_1003330 [compost metagenome]
MRGEQVLGAFEWHAFTAFGRCRRPGAGDESLLGEEPENGLAIGLGLIDAGVSHAAQFQGGRQVGRWNRCRRERPGQAQPWRRTGFIERAAAGVFTQQRHAGLQTRRQGLPLRPVLRQRVDVDGRVEIAMQVEGDVGVAGMAQQQAVHGFQLRWRCRQAVEDLAHGLANQRDVGLGIAAEAITDQRGHRRTEFDERAVEILAAAQLETPHVAALQVLVEANGIGHRHQFDHTLQLSLLFKFGQAFLQLPGRAHARQFVGVQAGLDVHLARARAITKHAEGALAAQVAPGQFVVDALHGGTPDVRTARSPVGASLLAKAALHSTSMLPDTTLSRAGSLPQVSLR